MADYLEQQFLFTGYLVNKNNYIPKDYNNIVNHGEKKNIVLYYG